MKQILQSYRSGELWLAEVPAPAARRGGVVVHTASSLVSAGTERMIIELAKKSLVGKARARPDLVKQVIAKIKTEGLGPTMTKVFAKLDAPIPLGYSAAGTVVEAGEGVLPLRAGDRVACGGAGYATHAQYNFIPKNLCVKIPDNVTFEDAAFTTLGAIAIQGVRQADPRLGERVAVIGLGLLGLLTVQMLKAAGCVVIASDLDADKCELAKKLGADDAVVADFPQAVEALTGGRGADAVIITAATKSNAPIEVAAEICRAKGRVVVVGMVGMDVPRDPFYKKELELRLSMSYGPGRYDPVYEEGGMDYPYAYVRWTEQRNLESFLYLVSQGKVTPSRLVTHRFGIDEALKAYQLLEGNGSSDEPGGTEQSEKYLAILLDYPPMQAGEVPRQKIELRSTPSATSATIIGSNRIGLAVIGAGNFVKGVLLPAIGRVKNVGGIELLGVCTATGMSASETAKKHGFAYATTQWQDILEDARINAVVVATRHNSHTKFACEALAAGKHVFLEKPLCIERTDMQRYERVFEETGEAGEGAGGGAPCLMVGFNRRFSSHARAMREAFTDCQTPRVLAYRINAGVIPRDSWLQDPAVGGGRIIGEVCHFVDFCEYVLDAIPVRAYASCVRGNTGEVDEDSLIATIEYDDGSLATIQYLAHGARQIPKERVELSGGGVTAIMDNFCTTTFFGGRKPKISGRQDKGFDAEIKAFFQTIKQGGVWPIELASLLRTTHVTFAIEESLRSDKPVEVGSKLELDNIKELSNNESIVSER